MNTLLTPELVDTAIDLISTDGITLQSANSYLELPPGFLHKQFNEGRNPDATPLQRRLYDGVKRALLLAEYPALRLKRDMKRLSDLPMPDPTKLSDELTGCLADLIAQEGVSFKTACEFFSVDYSTAVNWLATDAGFKARIDRANAIFDIMIMKQLQREQPANYSKQLLAIMDKRHSMSAPKTEQELKDEAELRQLEIEAKRKALQSPNENRFNFILVGQNATIPPEIQALMAGTKDTDKQ